MGWAWGCISTSPHNSKLTLKGRQTATTLFVAHYLWALYNFMAPFGQLKEGNADLGGKSANVL